VQLSYKTEIHLFRLGLILLTSAKDSRHMNKIKNLKITQEFKDYSKSIELSTLFINWHPYDKIIKAEAKKYKYVVFFGCGAIFSSIVETWNARVAEKINYCCDNNSEKWGKKYFGVECITYEKLLEIKNDTVIFITVGNFNPVYEQLISANFPAIHILYKYDLEAAQLIKSSDIKLLAKEAEFARSLLGDNKSKFIFDTIIKRSSGSDSNIMLMPSIFEGDQYFPKDLIKLSSNECYVDVGAYDGDTIRQFLKNCNNKFEKIYAFELDEDNFNKLESNFNLSDYKNSIKSYNLGAWSKRQSVSYSSGLTQSTIGGLGKTAMVAPLDEIIDNKKITFIKMDIEGAEIHALNGARKIITSQKPVLAICVYHKISHLWEIPLLIHEMLPDHNIFLRHHTPLEYETVCYALPKNDFHNK